MKKLIFLLFPAFLISFSTAYSQHSFGLKANAGVSQIKDNIKYKEGYLSYGMLSGQAGLYYNYDISKRFFIGTELTWMLVRGKQDYPNFFAGWQPPENLIGTQSKMSREINFLAVPLNFGYKVKKLSFDIGINTLYALSANQQFTGHLVFSDKPDQKTEYEPYSTEITKFVFAPRAGLAYALTEKIELECNFTFGSYNTNYERTYNFHQLTFGLRYKLF
ncbi:MAG: outer membrane beta-barrel protein [Bacteroidetes bacterium]|nr:outer membrane beta-barrel protein [Bacteroidota bacterium]